jgi:hypothetical protein
VGPAPYYIYPINPIEMIITHPYLFNAIVVFFIAFTSGWIVFVIISKKIVKLKTRLKKLENEKEHSHAQILSLEEQIEKNLTYPLNSTPVITLSSTVKVNKTN